MTSSVITQQSSDLQTIDTSQNVNCGFSAPASFNILSNTGQTDFDYTVWPNQPVQAYTTSNALSGRCQCSRGVSQRKLRPNGTTSRRNAQDCNPVRNTRESWRTSSCTGFDPAIFMKSNDATCTSAQVFPGASSCTFDTGAVAGTSQLTTTSYTNPEGIYFPFDRTLYDCTISQNPTGHDCNSSPPVDNSTSQGLLSNANNNPLYFALADDNNTWNPSLDLEQDSSFLSLAPTPLTTCSQTSHTSHISQLAQDAQHSQGGQHGVMDQAGVASQQETPVPVLDSMALRNNNCIPSYGYEGADMTANIEYTGGF